MALGLEVVPDIADLLSDVSLKGCTTHKLFASTVTHMYSVELKEQHMSAQKARAMNKKKKDATASKRVYRGGILWAGELDRRCSRLL